MGREVIWSAPALEDIEAVAGYIERDSSAYAAVFVRNVQRAAASLVEFPMRGQVVPEFGDSSIRELLVKPYRLVYLVEQERIIILALIHGAAREQR